MGGQLKVTLLANSKHHLLTEGVSSFGHHFPGVHLQKVLMIA